MNRNTHKFIHRCAEGTEIALEVDLSGDTIAIRTAFNARHRPDLNAEFVAFADSVTERVLPMLNHRQLVAAAVHGMQLIANKK